ncbi:hypothetical protein [Bifidobacterium sp. SO1]|uniref:hypothetical protein n=1 Tax=Bifidobacterium sp. SO1 TaxID=2809029 RepID=UPI001BDD5315|nr:hypothetical protein [Bifidobacterium sp. SO1]MBT1161831.1 hypothetical protein [Bifidobacterium sp. SO1]
MRIVFLIVMFPLSAYLTVLWRIMLSGSASDQAVIIYLLIAGLTIRNGWRRRARGERADAESGSSRANDGEEARTRRHRER